MLTTSAITLLRDIQGVPFPQDVNFRHIVVTGPLGSGKTTLIEIIRGWSGEGYVNLASNAWWRSRLFAFRPREVHFGIPLIGQPLVAEEQWLDVGVDTARIQLPPVKNRFYNVDWHSKFVFDVQLPDAQAIFTTRERRGQAGSHRLDRTSTLAVVKAELAAYESVALLLHDQGFDVYVRHEFQGVPRKIVSAG